MSATRQRLTEKTRGWLPLTALRTGVTAIPSDPTHKCSGGDHYTPGVQPSSVGGDHPPAASTVGFKISSLSANHIYFCVPKNHVLRPLGIGVPFVLHTERLHRRTFTCIQYPGVNGRLIGQTAHQTAEGLHLEDKLAFARSTHCRVTGHPTYGGGVAHKQGGTGKFGGGPGGFQSRVSPTNNDHIPATHTAGSVTVGEKRHTDVGNVRNVSREMLCHRPPSLSDRRGAKLGSRGNEAAGIDKRLECLTSVRPIHSGRSCLRAAPAPAAQEAS